MRSFITAHRVRLLAGLFVAPFAFGTYSDSADACGCLAPPIPQPSELSFAVNQQSEQIIFEVDEGFINAHVLIRYAGAPEEFGWLVPVPNVPELSLSYAGAFGLIDAQTGPTVTTTVESVCPSAVYACQEHPFPTGCNLPPQVGFTGAATGSVMGASPGAVASAGAASTTSNEANPVMVYAREQIGAYDTVVLGSGDAAAIVDWLNMNDFITNETMTPYMQPYLDQGMLFVAARLITGAGIEEIRPLRMRYEGAEPSIPLRLTAVASEPHLTVTAFIYSNEEFQPVDKPLVEPDPTQVVAALAPRGNYPMLLSRAVDDAGGDAFVREFSGTPPQSVALSTCCSVLTPPPVSEEPDEPVTDGGASSGGPGGQASGGDASGGDVSIGGAAVGGAANGAANGAAIGGAPFTGVPSSDFCGIGNDGQCQCPFDSFDQADCADAEETTGAIALMAELSGKYSHLTRLTTRLSPEEMTFDPAFEGNGETAERGRLTLTGKEYHVSSCEADVIDTELREQQRLVAACSSVYCGEGECAADAEGNAGCICDAGFAARLFTDLDGLPSVTCAPEESTVDLAAGGVDIPDVCSPYAQLDNGECIDVGGFPATVCEDGFVAVNLSVGVPSCVAAAELTGDPGASNNTAELLDLEICAPPPPVCSTFGWLESVPEESIVVPGTECPSSIPDPSWLVVPREPTCADYGYQTLASGPGGGTGTASPGTAGAATTGAPQTVTVNPSATMNTSDPRPELGEAPESSATGTSRSRGGCSVNPASGSSRLGWLVLGLLGVAARRARRTRR